MAGRGEVTRKLGGARNGRRRIAALAALSFAATAAIVAPAHGALATPADHDGGEPVHLPATPEPGQEATINTSISHVTEIGVIEVAVRVNSTVVTVNDDRSYTTLSTIEALNYSAPAGADLSAYDGLENVAFEGSFDARGVLLGTSLVDPGGLSDAQRSGSQDVADSFAVTLVGFPDEPVSIGTAWTTPGIVTSHGLGIDLSYQCRLVSLTESDYTLEVSYAQSFSAELPEGGVVEGTISGSGKLHGSRTNPLVISGTVWQTLDGVETVNGTSTPLHSDMTIDVAPADR